MILKRDKKIIEKFALIIISRDAIVVSVCLKDKNCEFFSIRYSVIKFIPSDWLPCYIYFC